MSKKLTIEEIKKRLQEKDPTIEVLGEFKKETGQAQKRIRRYLHCKCGVCGEVWETSLDSLNAGHGCVKCSYVARGSNRALIFDEFKERLNNINSNIKVLSDIYINGKTKIKCECLIDGNIWESRAESLLLGRGCIKCGIRKRTLKRTLTIEEVKFNLQQINSDVEILSTEYKNNRSKLTCKCKKCGHEWKAMYSHLSQGKGCPKCRASKGEKQIAKWLDINSIKYISQYKFKDCKNKKQLPFDFYIPNLNITIEFDGMQHYRPSGYSNDKEKMKNKLKTVQLNDLIKTKYCKEKGVNLIRIPYWEKSNIENILSENIFKKHFE